MPFEFKPVEILPELIIVEPRVFNDPRGFFLETYKESDFVKNGIREKFCQDNYSRSVKGVVRAIHYQLPPKAQGKLISVIKGKVWDVAVDLRRSSKTFLKWFGVEISAENHKMFYIPPGFGHGFVVLSDEVDFLYKCTNEFSPEHEKGIIWNDKTINIEWQTDNPIISDRDSNLPELKDAVIFD